MNTAAVVSVTRHTAPATPAESCRARVGVLGPPLTSPPVLWMPPSSWAAPPLPPTPQHPLFSSFSLPGLSLSDYQLLHCLVPSPVLNANESNLPTQKKKKKITQRSKHKISFNLAGQASFGKFGSHVQLPYPHFAPFKASQLAGAQLRAHLSSNSLFLFPALFDL